MVGIENDLDFFVHKIQLQKFRQKEKHPYICKKYTYMNVKLTLSLEKEVIENAKIYAKGTGRSLSEMVEKYFKNIVSKPENNQDIHPKVKKLIGRITLPPDFDEEKVKEEYYKEKYGF